MMDYNQFLDWASLHVWSKYLWDELSWNDSIGDIVTAGAAIYNTSPYELNRAIWQRTETVYGNPLED